MACVIIGLLLNYNTVCKKMVDYRRERNSVTDLRIHLTLEGLNLIEESFHKVANSMDFKVLEFNGESDHIHALIEYPPKLSISQIVNALKGVSSRLYGKAGLPKPYGKVALWSPSYFALSVGGAPLEVLKAYIANQSKLS